MDPQEHNINAEEAQQPQEYNVYAVGPQQNNNARLNKSRSCHLNNFFQNFTTVREEIIDNGSRSPYKWMIFEYNYCH